MTGVVWSEPDEPGDEQPPARRRCRPSGPPYVCARCDSGRWALTAGPPGYWVALTFHCWGCGATWRYQLGRLGEYAHDDSDDSDGGQ